MNRSQIELWALRLVWLAIPLVVGSSIRSALGTVASTPGLIVEVALWLAWFVGLVACLTPHPISLTAIRILAPAIIGIAIIAGLRVGFDAASFTAIGFGLFVSVVALLPSIGDSMANGSAYGSERRMALRTPAVAYLGPIPLAWSAVFASLVVWALFLANERYVLAVIAALVGVVGIWAGGRLLYQLARRWIVFVPAGFVIHDPFQLAEPVLVGRSRITRLGPAEASDASVAHDAGEKPDQSLDLSAGSLGLALAVESSEPVVFGYRHRGQVEVRKTSKVVFSPTLPGALLSEARIRGIKIRGSSGVS